MHQQEPASPHASDRDWRELAERAAREMDPSRLTELVNQLCDKLDEARPHSAGGYACSPHQVGQEYRHESH